MLFSGAMTALVTPFKNNTVDEETYRAFIERQITEGIHGLVPCGTTGESATLSHEEHERVIEICIDQPKAGCRCWPGPVPTIPAKPSAWPSLPKRPGPTARC